MLSIHSELLDRFLLVVDHPSKYRCIYSKLTAHQQPIVEASHETGHTCEQIGLDL